MSDIDLSKLSLEQLKALQTAAGKMAKEKESGVSRHEPAVVKLAGEITALATKMNIDPVKVISAIGYNLKPERSFRAYPVKNEPKAAKTPKKK